MESVLLSELRSGVARLTLNRADKRNALTRELLVKLQSEVERAGETPEVRLLILEANGPAFCAGMDLAEMQQRANDPDAAQQWQRDSQVYARVLKSIYAAPFPILAADSAFFALPEPARGITAAMVTPLLIHRVGAGAATFQLLSGQRISAATALAHGVCHEVVASAHLSERRDQWIQAILAGSPAALRITKQHLQHCAPRDVEQLIDDSIKVSARARETDDAREGLAAFLAKRKPNWQPD
jgi:methylglutaconyl-CoA hydratase